MSLRTTIESLPGRVVRGVFGTSDAMDINKTVGAILVAGLLAMVSGLVANVLVPSEEGGHGGEAAVAHAPGGEATGGAEGGAEPAAATAEPILPLLASADAQAGAAVAKKCTSCHTFEKGGAAKVGPNLYGIVGAKHAHMEGFAYSEAMQAKGGEWTYEELNHFIANPRGYIPGTKMGFGGIKGTQDRANLIAYLRTTADTPAPLPTDQEINAAMAEQQAGGQAGAQPEGGQELQGAAATDASQISEQPAQPTGSAEAAGAGTAEQVSPTEGEQQVPAGASQAGEAVNQAAAQQQVEQTAQAGQQQAAAAGQQAASPGGGGGELGQLIAAANPDQGKQVARKCTACHSFEAGGPNKVGPNLAGTVGSDIAAKDFPYSDALKGKEGAWTDAALDAFLTNPKGWAPGTKMTFPGLKKPEERAAVIAYLRSVSPNAPPLQ
jgi:cytochrome c